MQWRSGSASKESEGGGGGAERGAEDEERRHLERETGEIRDAFAACLHQYETERISTRGRSGGLLLGWVNAFSSPLPFFFFFLLPFSFLLPPAI